MKVTSIKNVSKKRVEVEASDGMKISLPPNKSFEDIDVTNLTELGEDVSYVANLTEVGKPNESKKQLYD